MSRLPEELASAQLRLFLCNFVVVSTEFVVVRNEAQLRWLGQPQETEKGGQQQQRVFVWSPARFVFLLFVTNIPWAAARRIDFWNSSSSSPRKSGR
jgi:hypothetical protein